jgi:hypothetical protein
VDSDDEELLGRSCGDPGRSCGDPGRSCGDPLIETKEIENYKIENYSLSPVATPPVDKSDLCHFDVIESVTAPLEESMSNSDPDPFKAFDSVSDLDQSCEISTTTTKDGLESIEAPELVLGSSPEPKTAKKRLKRDQTVSKKTDKSKQTEGSLFLDIFDTLRYNYENRLYGTHLPRNDGGINSMCARIVRIIKSPVERYVMMLWYFTPREKDIFVQEECTHSLNIFLKQIYIIRDKAKVDFKRKSRISNDEADYQYANANFIETATGYRIEFAPPQQKNID